MNIVLATQKYVEEMIRCAGPGMKVLLMDKETTSLISCVFSQSDMMQREVYLFERLDSHGPRDPIKYLKCIIFVRPTAENVQLITEELRKPRFSCYHIYFSNIISKTDVKMFAEADEQESVRDVFEFFIDGIALSPHLMSLELPYCYETRFSLSPTAFRRSLNGLLALCLALNKRPYVRYQSSSRDSQRLSEELTKLFVREEALFQERVPSTGNDDDTMLLVVSRSEDAVSPLLNQWTYEAMVHELLGIVHNRVKIQGEDGQLNDVLLSSIHDEFYAANMYLNFGELGQNIKELMNEYQTRAQTHQKLESISDMKHFVEQYPQFKKMSGAVSKHMTMLCELNRLVSKLNLLEVSELEQTIVSSGERSQCLDAAQKLLRMPSVQNHDALRLVMLYALRFESHVSIADDLNGLVSLLRERKVPSHQIAAIRTVQEYGGAANRQNDLFGNQSAMEITKRFIKGLKGVENIYTHHQPYLAQIVDQIARGKLPDGAYPYAGSVNRYLTSSCRSYIRLRGALAASIPENVIVFMVGGATFEESAWIHNYNQQIPQQKARGRAAPRLLLASTHVHNSRSFIEQMTRLSPGGAGSTHVSLG
uniref:Vacuolar protein sorting-associated protein 45 n=1 Tax=Steinernema glaseri TaxID=37863 RepID=A0A1I7ZMW8_9BILA